MKRDLEKSGGWVADALPTLVGLGAFAVAQPLFDVLATHTAFLVAHRIARLDLLLLTGALCLGPGLAAFALVALARTVSRGIGRGALLGFVALGIGATILPPLHRFLGAPGAVLVVLALAVAAGAAFAYTRLPGVRSFARLLALGAVGFPVWFLVLSPAAKLLAASGEPAVPPAEVPSNTPVVLIVFDQFPLFTLLDENEQIDRERHPSFAALADTADWYRNATTVASETTLAVPAILTGRYPDGPRLPTFNDYPQNLFTLLGHDYALNIVQTLTDLCPPSLCAEAAEAEPRGERLAGVTRDLFYVYLHVLLPSDLQAGLPDVGGTWRDFEATEWIAQDATPDDPHASWGDPTSALSRFLAGIDTRKRVLHFLHINIPHVPWKYLPSGTEYGPVGNHLYPYPMNGLADVSSADRWALDRALQRHLLQVGFADTLLDRIRQRLVEEGVWDDALVIVTADHGVTFWPTSGLGEGDERAVSDVLNVPLFLKRPGSLTGSISDANVETIDILPTIAAVLGVSAPLPFDGRPLGSDETRARKQIFIDAGGDTLLHYEYGDRLAGRRLSVHRLDRVFGDGPDWLFTIGDHESWIGRALSELPQAEAHDLHVVELERAGAFTNVDLDSGFLPARVAGSVSPATGTRPAARVGIALNGVLWATTPTFETATGAAGFAAMVPEAAFRSGANRIEVFVIEGRGKRSVLTATRQDLRRVFELRTEPDGQTVLRGPDGEIPIRPGALTGQINVRGPMLAGWTRDATHDALPESVVIFANGLFHEERHLSRVRANTAARAHLRDADQKTFAFDVVIPFETLRQTEHPELRAFAISRGVASELEPVEGFPYGKSLRN